MSERTVDTGEPLRTALDRIAWRSRGVARLAREAGVRKNIAAGATTVDLFGLRETLRPFGF